MLLSLSKLRFLLLMITVVLAVTCSDGGQSGSTPDGKNGEYGGYAAMMERVRLPDVMGGGVCVTDFDSDGDPDLFHTHTGWVYRESGDGIPDILLENLGGGRMRDISAKAGIRVPNFSMGCAVADIDNDGDEDVYVSGVRQSLLYVNAGGGRFVESAGAAGITHGGFSTSAAFDDFDRDGWVDLFVARYVDLDSPGKGELASCASKGFPEEFCPLLPDFYPPMTSVLYRNLGNGTFQDVSATSGIAGRKNRSLAVSWNDFDRDGDADLYVANDHGEENLLYASQGEGRFEEKAAEFGVAVKATGHGDAGMGVDFSDVDNDGDWDFFVTNGPPEGSTFYLHRKDGTFLDGSKPIGFSEWTAPFVAFGATFGDLDGDGWPDLFVATGGVIPPPFNADSRLPAIFQMEMPQPNLVFRNLAGRGFQPWIATPPLDVSERGVSRGAAVVDLDQDGALDVVVSHLGAPPSILMNRLPTPSWLGLRLRGTRSNRRAIGAEVELESDGRKQLRRVTAGSSYLSQNSLDLHFGLGEAKRADRATLRWPSGLVQTLENLPAGGWLEVEEPNE